MIRSTIARLWFMVSALLVSIFSSDALPAQTDTPPIQRVLFGSCMQQDEPAPIFTTMLGLKPELLLFLGDNIYADTNDMSKMERKYSVLAAHPTFQPLREFCPLMTTWDDHDFGQNDSGAEYAERDASQRLFLDFWKVPADSPRRKQQGVYDAAIFGPEGKRLQVIMLDTRYFRSPLKRGEKRLGGPYEPDDDPSKTMLGEAQWKWLEGELRKPAEVRLLVSSIQCLSEADGHETWANLPHERQRLYTLIADTQAQGVVILSGDRHWAELSVARTGVPYPLYDLTSSSFNQIHPRGTPTENSARALPTTFHRENFGVVTIEWGASEPFLQLEVRDVENRSQIVKRLWLSELKSGLR